MKDKPFTKEQAKMMILTFLGLSMLTIRSPMNQIFGIVLGIIIFVFSLFILFREFICRRSVEVKEKLISIGIILSFFCTSVVLIFDIFACYPFICFFSGIIIILWGCTSLIGAKSMAKIYVALIFSIVGTVILFTRNSEAPAVVHAFGIMLSDYGISAFLKEKLG